MLLLGCQALTACGAVNWAGRVGVFQKFPKLRQLHQQLDNPRHGPRESTASCEYVRRANLTLLTLATVEASRILASRRSCGDPATSPTPDGIRRSSLKRRRMAILASVSPDLSRFLTETLATRQETYILAVSHCAQGSATFPNISRFQAKSELTHSHRSPNGASKTRPPLRIRSISCRGEWRQQFLDLGIPEGIKFRQHHCFVSPGPGDW